MTANRRRFLSGAGAALVGAIGIGAGTSVTADGHDIPVVIAAVDVERELVTLENTGDEDFDLSQYVMDWEHDDNEDQTITIGDGEGDATIEAGGQLTLATGATSGDEPVPDADVTFNYGENDHQIADDETDVIALLSPGGEVVATFDTSDGTQGSGDGGGDGDGGDGGDGGDTGDGDDGNGGDGEDADDDGETDEDGEEVDDDDSDDSDDDDSDDSDDDDSDDSDDDDSDGGDESAGDDTEDCPDCDEDHAADEDCPEEEPEPEPEEDDC